MTNIPPPPKAKGLLIYANGKVEEIEPCGVRMVRGCEHCGSELLFDSTDVKMAENELSTHAGDPMFEKTALLLARSPNKGGWYTSLNGGVVVYVQRPKKER